MTISPKCNFLVTFYIKKKCMCVYNSKSEERRGPRDQQIKAYKFYWPRQPLIFPFPSLLAYNIPTSLWFLHVKPPQYFLACRVPVAGIEAFERVKGKWFCLTRTPSNFFSSEGMGAVSFPLKVRLTSIMNEQLEATIGALKNDVVINSDVQFSDTKVRGKRYTCQYVLSLFIGLIDFFNPSWFYSSLVMFWLGQTI